MIKNTKIKLDVKDRSTLWNEARKEKNKNNKNKNLLTFYLNEKLVQKMNKLKIENKTSYTEIIKHLLEITDLNKLEFSNKAEIYSVAAKYAKIFGKGKKIADKK